MIEYACSFVLGKYRELFTLVASVNQCGLGLAQRRAKDFSGKIARSRNATPFRWREQTRTQYSWQRHTKRFEGKETRWANKTTGSTEPKMPSLPDIRDPSACKCHRCGLNWTIRYMSACVYKAQSRVHNVTAQRERPVPLSHFMVSRVLYWAFFNKQYLCILCFYVQEFLMSKEARTPMWYTFCPVPKCSPFPGIARSTVGPPSFSPVSWLSVYFWMCPRIHVTHAYTLTHTRTHTHTHTLSLSLSHTHTRTLTHTHTYVYTWLCVCTCFFVFLDFSAHTRQHCRTWLFFGLQVPYIWRFFVTKCDINPRISSLNLHVMCLKCEQPFCSCS